MTQNKPASQAKDKVAAEENAAQDDIFGTDETTSTNVMEEPLNVFEAGDEKPSDVTAELDALKAKLKQQEEAVLRSLAEQENIVRRCERDVSHARKYAVEKLVLELLPVIDSLEKALEMTDDSEKSTQSMREGIRLTLKLFHEVMVKQGIEVVDPKGESFNPELHEAMVMQASNEVAEGTVLEVFQKGYRLNQRLVRPAKVVVAKASAE